jgi:NADP-reducing hydrogenase subunit HndB
LRQLRERAKASLSVRGTESGPKVTIAMGTCGIAAGAREVLSSLLEELEQRGLENVTITQTGCKGLCDREPLVEVQVPGGPDVTYGSVTPAIMRRIVADHIVNGHVVNEYAVAIGSEAN